MSEAAQHRSAGPLAEGAVEIPVAWRAGRTPEQKAEILRSRALELAKPLGDEGPKELTDLVTLAVGASRFAVEADVVREVVSLEGLAALPGTPDFVLGLLNVRGAIVAAIDLCPVLGVGKARADWPQVVVLRTASMEVGIAADACAMAHVTRSELRPVADNPEQPYVKATVEAGVEVLDIEKIIAATQHTLQSAAAREGA